MAQIERTATARIGRGTGGVGILISQLWNSAMLPPTTTLQVRIQAISRRFRGRVAEWHLALVTLICGIFIIWPGDTFDLSPYVYMRGIASETTWGVMLVLLGLARMAVLGVNGAMPRGAPHMRAVAALLSVVVWSAMLAGYATLGVPTIGAAMLIGAIIADCVNGYRAAGAARVEDDSRK